MAVGTIDASILTDIANAIRFQSGTSALMKPREMAAAVLALDGTDAGGYVAQAYKALESGVLSEGAFTDIADAIRAQNGSSDTYLPGDMAAAILALSWDVGLKPRAVPTSLGTLEFNYVDGRHCYSGGTPVDAWEVSTTGYSSASARPWDSIKLQVTRVVIDSSFASLGVTNCAYWFNGFTELVEVSGFENLSGVTNATQMFTSCAMLESVYATSFANAIASGSSMFYGCNRLVGGADGFVPTTTSAGSVCRLGSGGVLTDPNADQRTWFWGHFYEDGEAVLAAPSTPDPTRATRASGRICAIAKCQGLGFAPWTGAAGATHRQHLAKAAFVADMAAFAYLNLQYLFCSATNLAQAGGLGNLQGVRSMRFMFSSCAFTELDFTGFGPSRFTDPTYAFSGRSSLATIHADSAWALPSSGVTGGSCFYGCSSLVGGAGTAYASSKTSCTCFRIDTASTPGCLTAA